MEFYALPLYRLCSRSYVSIPNGMEFYATAVDIIKDAAEFQFPTGWNSTRILS